MNSCGRFFEKITEHDLTNLYRVANEAMTEVYKSKPDYKPFQDKAVVVALCQGAALHYIDGKTGVKDFDVWFFYAPIDGKSKWHRGTLTVTNFGDSKFGKLPDKSAFKDKRVDVLMRAMPEFSCGDPKKSIQDYLTSPVNTTPKYLAKKAVIGLYPKKVFGKTLWSSK